MMTCCGVTGARRTNGVGGERLCGRRAHNFFCANIKWWVAHAEIESARVTVVSHENTMGHGAWRTRQPGLGSGETGWGRWDQHEGS